MERLRCSRLACQYAQGFSVPLTGMPDAISYIDGCHVGLARYKASSSDLMLLASVVRSTRRTLFAGWLPISAVSARTTCVVPAPGCVEVTAMASPPLFSRGYWKML